MPASPSAIREFPTGDDLALAVDVYDNKATTPHRVEILTVDRIRPGFELRGSTENLGWRYFIHGAGGAIAAATNPAGEAARYSMGRRIREVEQGPDGAIWLLEDGSNVRLLKLTPVPF